MKFYRQICFLSLCGSLGLLSAGCGHVYRLAEFRGRMEARRDLAAGHPRILSWGYISLPNLARHERLRRLLESRYGLKEDGVAGCTVTNWQRAQWDSYNTTIVGALESKYGQGFFQRAVEAVYGPRPAIPRPR